MSSSCDAPARGTVIRGGNHSGIRPARFDADLGTSPFAVAAGVDARLTDPYLEGVVERASEAARAAGDQRGYAEGIARGLSDARDQAHAEAQAVRARTERAERDRDEQVSDAVRVLLVAAEAFRDREAVTVAEIEDTVVDLALALARSVLDREISASADPGREAIARALSLAPASVPATVRLHPDDAAGLSSLDSVLEGRSVVVVADPSVERGGCVADAAGRRIDAQIGAAIDRAAAVLR